MKRTVIILSLIFALAIALSASIPTMAVTTQTTWVKGTVPSAVDIQAMTNVSLPTLNPGTTVNTEPTGLTVNVKSNKANWTLKVKDNVGSGYMQNASALIWPLQVKGGTVSSYTSISGSDLTLTSTGAKGNPTPIAVNFSQQVDWADNPADYSIQLIFTASPAP